MIAATKKLATKPAKPATGKRKRRGNLSSRRRDPTPAEIREACAAIQATWTPEVEYARRIGDTLARRWLRGGWSPPEFSTSTAGMYEPRVTPEMMGRGSR